MRNYSGNLHTEKTNTGPSEPLHNTAHNYTLLLHPSYWNFPWILPKDSLNGNESEYKHNYIIYLILTSRYKKYVALFIMISIKLVFNFWQVNHSDTIHPHAFINKHPYPPTPAIKQQILFPYRSFNYTQDQAIIY